MRAGIWKLRAQPEPACGIRARKFTIAERNPSGAGGEIGIHASFRNLSRKRWRFESSPAHMFQNLLDQLSKQFISFFSSGTIYISDGLDVFLVAILIYAILLLLKQTRSFLILFGLFILGIIFLIAKLLNLYLTSLALQSIFSVIFIVIIVVFQTEIRRLFELIALFSTRQIKRQALPQPTSYVNELVQATATLSHEKNGALIILSGRDDLNRFLEGGTLADCVISEELIDSIFDPHSSGHDGAMIISKSRIMNFGTHLPLSTNFKEIGKHGTRHSAALGISELTDCLAIVVSEETGSISIAREGKLKKLTGADELSGVLSRFLKLAQPGSATSLFRQVLQKDQRLKLLSIALAILLWVTFAFRAETVTKDFVVPVAFSKLSESTLIEDYSPREINIKIEGRGDSSFSDLDPASLKVELDSLDIKDGLNTFTITDSNIRLPLKFTVSSIQPQSIFVSAKKYRSVALPIKVALAGAPAKNFQVTDITASPSTVEIWLPEKDFQPVEIITQPVKITASKVSVLGEYELILPPGAKLKKASEFQVSVAVTIESN